jgi:hypothetical protein
MDWMTLLRAACTVVLVAVALAAALWTPDGVRRAEVYRNGDRAGAWVAGVLVGYLPAALLLTAAGLLWVDR